MLIDLLESSKAIGLCPMGILVVVAVVVLCLTVHASQVCNT